jgi:hypothetical protein
MSYGLDIFSRILDDVDICARANDRGIKDVLVLDTLLPDKKGRVIRCGK